MEPYGIRGTRRHSGVRRIRRRRPHLTRVPHRYLAAVLVGLLFLLALFLVLPVVRYRYQPVDSWPEQPPGLYLQLLSWTFWNSTEVHLVLLSLVVCSVGWVLVELGPYERRSHRRTSSNPTPKT